MTGNTAPSEWWRGAVIYQIYPRSFLDTDGNGIGDIKGITGKLDYVASLGVDAIWLSPFFKSPMKDYGYDVADYCDVDPLFGTLADFKTMLDKAHSLNMKIIIDLVLSHTSDEHPWFTESRSSRTNPKSDWYVWADPQPDGSPPTNWQSVFGGSSWSFDIRRGQYYLHNFLQEQPDLNLHNPDVETALFKAMEFWLDMGVDGFRLDAAAHYFHKQDLKDNPPNPNPAPSSFNIAFPTPFTMQLHENDISLPHTIAFMKKVRTLLDRYDDRMAVAEIGGDDGILLAAQFTDGPAMLHTAYNFSLISGDKASAAKIRDTLEYFHSLPYKGWPSWAFSNHDVVRVASRWHPDKTGYNHDDRLSKTLIALLGCLQGSVFLYQGEELGLPEATLTFEQIQDPWGKFLYPAWQGRDGCRTPMPWDSKAPHAGFGTATPWLPIPAEHLHLSVNVQEKDPDSALNFTRRFMAWRKEQPALRGSDIQFLDTDTDNLLAFTRTEGAQTILCVFNFADTPQNFKFDGDIKGGEAIFTAGALSGHKQGQTITLPPYGLFVSA